VEFDIHLLLMSALDKGEWSAVFAGRLSLVQELLLSIEAEDG
jgi:hypothetical protein